MKKILVPSKPLKDLLILPQGYLYLLFHDNPTSPLIFQEVHTCPLPGLFLCHVSLVNSYSSFRPQLSGTFFMFPHLNSPSLLLTLIKLPLLLCKIDFSQTHRVTMCFIYFALSSIATWEGVREENTPPCWLNTWKDLDYIVFSGVLPGRENAQFFKWR